MKISGYMNYETFRDYWAELPPNIIVRYHDLDWDEDPVDYERIKIIEDGRVAHVYCFGKKEQ
jgi:hypothetical protein